MSIQFEDELVSNLVPASDSTRSQSELLRNFYTLLDNMLRSYTPLPNEIQAFNLLKTTIPAKAEAVLKVDRRDMRIAELISGKPAMVSDQDVSRFIALISTSLKTLPKERLSELDMDETKLTMLLNTIDHQVY